MQILHGWSTKLLTSYSWREVWATDRPFIRCRCFQRFSGCHAMAHSARLDNNNNTSNPSPASALYYKSTFNKRRWCAWWVFFSTQFADRLRNASTSIVGKNTAKVWWFLQAGSFTLICNSIMKEAFRIFLPAGIWWRSKIRKRIVMLSLWKKNTFYSIEHSRSVWWGDICSWGPTHCS